MTNQLYIKKDEISIGEWCIIEHDNKIMVGLILSFAYMKGKTFKERQFSKSTALVQPSAKPIGLLGSWYSWNKEGELQSCEFDHTTQKHEFLPIKCYRGSMCRPSYDKKFLKISLELMVALNAMQNHANLD